ncbi:hypothetical protein DR864_02240 [Runella rosea]|uniref:Uncharacterized protein n=1 Tax=Runella rosea TaxID=2259595 RepID=A0A344TDA7_9BACT|nr:hypothetical protein [Runella rosea]AXE16628.1 hypothetical protein DR864_02240 [Runella rosea]
MKRSTAALLFVFVLPLVWSCEMETRGWDGLCISGGEASGRSYVESYDFSDKKTFEKDSQIVVYHGSACGKLTQKISEDEIVLQGNRQIPRWATHATVFLNGWKLEYESDDHHVRTVGAGIGHINLTVNQNRKEVNWTATGVLGDYNFDDAYNFCYHYTVIAWNEAKINLAVDHDENCASGTSTYNMYPIAGYLQNNVFKRRVTAGVVPRGFFFRVAQKEDHHLLQLSYNVVGSERILQNKIYDNNPESTNTLPRNSSRYDSAGVLSWKTQGIFKDNQERWEPFIEDKGYYFGEMVTGIGGKDLGIIHPPFLGMPVDDNGFWTGTIPQGSNQIVSKEYTITNIPYENALPVLSGWDIHYEGGDHHVRKIGIWISDWSYSKPVRASRGTLKYTLSTILTDDEENSSLANHRVTVLGIKPTAIAQPEDGNILPELDNDF